MIGIAVTTAMAADARSKVVAELAGIAISKIAVAARRSVRRSHPPPESE